MKDLEKIKSEDLACQVQDANPANFAIEQEVAQLVGATVPQPTQPSADDASELGAQLLVFLRRALTPIQSALRTAVAAIYAHLDSRCTDYTPAAYASYQPLPPYDPMGTPPTPRTLPNLLTALTAFAPRKISNGSAPNDGIPDGTSLAQLLCSAASADVTKIVDDNHGWTMTKGLPTLGTYTYIKLNCAVLQEVQISTSAELVMDELETVNRTGTWHAAFNYDGDRLSFPNLKTINGYQGSTGVFAQGNYKELLIPKVTRIHDNPGYHGCFLGAYQGRDSHNLRRLVVGRLTDFSWNFGGYYNTSLVSPCLDFIDFEIGAGTAINLDCSKWNPTNALSSSASDLVADPTAHPTWKNLDQFLQNFKEHIALRLTSNGSGKTLTLSQAVRDAIHAAEATYGIEAIIVTQKGWTLSPAPTA